MKATGVVRRIDDLGRVVIPKEIRRSLNIEEGDPLEIYIDDKTKSVMFKKYLENENALEEIQDIIDNSNDVPDVVKDLLKVAAKILKENLKMKRVN